MRNKTHHSIDALTGVASVANDPVGFVPTPPGGSRAARHRSCSPAQAGQSPSRTRRLTARLGWPTALPFTRPKRSHPRLSRLRALHSGSRRPAQGPCLAATSNPLVASMAIRHPLLVLGATRGTGTSTTAALILIELGTIVAVHVRRLNLLVRAVEAHHALRERAGSSAPLIPSHHARACPAGPFDLPACSGRPCATALESA